MCCVTILTLKGQSVLWYYKPFCILRYLDTVTILEYTEKMTCTQLFMYKDGNVPLHIIKSMTCE